MDNLVSLYTTTDGRIGRQQWWIGVLILGGISIVISLIVMMIFGLWNNMQGSAWVSLILLLVLAYPIYCLYLKRRHDRDNAGLDSTVFIGVLVLSMLLQALGLSFSPMEIQGVVVPTPTLIGSIVGLVVFVYAIYMLVVLGFLKGTDGPNQYGPDPLGAQ